MSSLGRYQLIATLGQGGMGTIHLAVASGLGRFRKLVVVKALRDELALDEKFVEMFMREAALAACFSHPNVVQTVEAGYADGRYFLVMEFLDGQPLGKLLRGASRKPELPLSLRLNVLCEALLGLHYVHELRGYDGRPLHFVHRDVSPPNIFVTYDGQVKLLDFGIANARDGDGSRPGEFKGKLSYAAPEQLCGRPADRRIDVFAAGVVLWESIALRSLANGTPTRETFAARVAGTEPRIEHVVPGVEPALAHICERAMHPDPDARYQTAEDLRTALMCYLTEREELVDSSVIGQFMQAKFARARAAIHRRIDAHIRDIPAQHVRFDSLPTPTTDIVVPSGPFEPMSARVIDLQAQDGRFEPLPTRVTPLERPALARSSSLSLRERTELEIESRTRSMRHTRRVVLRRFVAVAGLALAAAALWLAHSSRQAAAEPGARQRGVGAMLTRGVQAVLSKAVGTPDAGELARAIQQAQSGTSGEPEDRASLAARPKRESEPQPADEPSVEALPPSEPAPPVEAAEESPPSLPEAPAAQPLEEPVAAQPLRPPASPPAENAVAPVVHKASPVLPRSPADKSVGASARAVPSKPKLSGSPTVRPRQATAPAANMPSAKDGIELHQADRRVRRRLDEENPFR